MLLVCEKGFVISYENGKVFNKQMSDIEHWKIKATKD